MLANITGDWPYILIAVIVLFGGSQLPKLARNAGEAMKEFKKAHEEATSSPLASTSNIGTTVTTAPSAPQVAPAALPSGSVSPAQSDEHITLTRTELDALLADREARAKSARSADSPQS
ncbi:MAG: twin-arginine translocase TatA/TatE family subunit [Acidimicrobiales bacterium]|jgi:TatA/E family protein of Tat protein translocase